LPKNLSHDEIVTENFDNLARGSDEFLTSFDLCREDFLNQVKSIIYQQEKLQKLFKKVEDLSRFDI